MENRVVLTRQGKLRGVPGCNPDITVFKGVPYARPPIGNLRWRAPMPPVSWNGIRKADHFEAMPVQTQGYFLPVEPFEDLYAAEDCLYLNIWSPARKGDEDLAVLVWFHGGAFQGGMAHDPMFDGEYLAAKGIILVTVGYRLNVFGFLCHPDMEAESPYKTAGNFGILDQMAALQWIHDNISEFGGNPEKVTIAGQSAGGMSVSCLMTTTLTGGLFRGAIIESGDPLGLYTHLQNNYEKRLEDGKKITEYFGVKTLNELRQIPADQLVRADFDAAMSITGQFCTPVVDGSVIPWSPADALLNGMAASDIPMLFGCNKDDGLSLEAEDAESYRETVRKLYGADSDRILERFPCGDEEERKQSVSALSAIQWQQRLRLLMKAREQRGIPSWQYFLTEGVVSKGISMGATHSAELGFVFGNLSYAKKTLEVLFSLLHIEGDKQINVSKETETEQKLTELMSEYWTQFVKELDPNKYGLPDWHCSADDGSRLSLGKETCMISDDNEEISNLVYKNCCRQMFKNA